LKVAVGGYDSLACSLLLSIVSPNLSGPRYALALHTTTPDLGLALDVVRSGVRSGTVQSDRVESGGIQSETTQQTINVPRSLILSLGREMATTLHQHLQMFLAPQSWEDLAFLAVAKGPGGFTGTRLGLVTARTIAQQLELPLFALSTLETLAFHHAHTTGTWAQSIAITLPAQRGQLFGGLYRCSSDAPPETIAGDQVYEPEGWQQCLDTYQPQQILTFSTSDPLAHSVTTILDLAQRYWRVNDPVVSRPHWLQALPFYGQDPVNQ
jgi:tRNA threonylcarbamoyl adenosine modification protein YeaZ